MPESKKDQSLRARAEVANFLECGDARGQTWLAKHPADVERAALALESLTSAHAIVPESDAAPADAASS